MHNAILTRRVAEIIDRKHLESALRSGKKLRVKFGIDPTAPDIHIGHAVPIWKLREFQEAGHTAVLIIGDWTAQIGDPSGRDKTRVSLSAQQVKINARHYFAQASKILDKNKTEVRWQSEWFKKFNLTEFIKLGSKVSTGYMLSHETFRKRLKNDLPFAYHETFYPLLQAYDSIAVKADVELGALEQKFNLLMGRKLQKFYNQAPQDIMMVPYLIGLDGKEKMSKTLNNYISLMDSAGEMFGKVMSLSDDLIGHYFELCTEVPEKEIVQINKLHPKAQKVRLAKEIVTIYHGPKAASAAAAEFEKKFGKRGGEVKADFELRKKPGNYPIIDLLVEGRLASSKSEARRKIAEGAVEVDGMRIKDAAGKISINKKTLIRLGKRFLRIR